jgi:hypothetical protein
VPIGRSPSSFYGIAGVTSSYVCDTTDGKHLSMKNCGRLSAHGQLHRPGTVLMAWSTTVGTSCEKFLKVASWGVDSAMSGKVSTFSNKGRLTSHEALVWLRR